MQSCSVNHMPRCPQHLEETDLPIEIWPFSKPLSTTCRLAGDPCCWIDWLPTVVLLLAMPLLHSMPMLLLLPTAVTFQLLLLPTALTCQLLLLPSSPAVPVHA